MQVISDTGIDFKNSSNTTFFDCSGSGGYESVTLKYGGSTKLSTVSAGVYVQGSLEATSGVTPGGNITMQDNEKIIFGAGNDLEIYHDTTNSYIKSNTNELKIAGKTRIVNNSNTESIALFTPDGSVELYYNNSKKFETTTSGVRLPDNQKVELGDGSDLQIWSDNTDQYIRGEQNQLLVRSNNLKLQSYLGENYIHCAMNYDVSLFYDNSKKFETTSTGAKVTGALEVTQEYPSIRPTLDLNFAATKTLDRRITFTRDSVGTYIDENGLVKYASNNVPRFDHDFDTRESLGLLIEESRTNKFTYSTTIGGTGWNNLQGTAADYTTNTTEVAAPDGTFTALKWSPSAIPQYLYQNLSNIGTTQSTMSVWVRCPAGQSRTFFMNLYSPTQNGGAGQFTATDQWQRFTWTFTPQSQANVYPIVPDSTGTYYIWGPQLEEGAFATSYIPTSGSTVTRAVDSAKITGTNFTNFHNATEGTLYGEYKSTSETAPYIVMLSDGTDNNRTIINANYDSYQGVVKYNNGTNHAVIDGGTPIANANNKTTLAFKKDDFALSLNGGTVATDTSGDVSVNNMMTIGSRRGIDSFANTTINAIKYYNKRLPNAQLQGLTQQ